MSEVESGFSSRILRTPDGRCVRAARTPEAARRHRTEAAVLPMIAEAVRIDVPWPMEFSTPSAEFPYGAWTMPWLPGTEVDASVDPASVASFLRDLRSIAPARVEPIVGTFAHWCDSQRALATAGVGALQGRLDGGLLRDLAAMLEEVGPRLTACSRPTLIHGDLWYGNLLMSEGRLSGVLDWEFVAVGDPLQDLAGLWYLGDAFTAALLAELGTTAHDLPDRFGYYRIVRELHGVTWSIDQGDAAELAESVEKVESVARSVLSGSSGRRR